MTVFYDQDADATTPNAPTGQPERRRLTHDIDRAIIAEQRQTIAMLEARIAILKRVILNERGKVE